ncbi:MAG TPA: cyclic nucleotide-binding domain-containing protein [bacterium]|mgnify:CR=1 FL=1|nr:cyclic nucleotide-binding domain-containing protein [bacterium]
MSEIRLLQKEDVKKLKNCVLFSNFSLENIGYFLEDALVLSYNEGEYIFREKEKSDSMYIIIEGKVKISNIAQDKEVIFTYLKNGDFFGEIAMLTKQQRTSDVSTVEPSELVMLTSENFEKMRIKYPDLLSDLYKQMLLIVCNRLKITDQKVLIKTIFRG